MEGNVHFKLSCPGASGGLWTTCYSYDAASNLLTKTDNRNAVTSYSYDAANRVAQVATGACPSGASNPTLGLPAYVTGSNSTSGTAIQYAPQGSPSSYVYGNGLARSIQYNNRLQMTGFVDSMGSGSNNEFLNVTLSWLKNGNPTLNNGNLYSASYQNGGATANNNGTGFRIGVGLLWRQILRIAFQKKPQATSRQDVETAKKRLAQLLRGEK
jgi:YD repeat-containing protein